MRYIVTLYFIFLSTLLFAQKPDYAQKENSVWWFGAGATVGNPGSTGLNFNAGTPAVSILSNAATNETATNVCDKNGNILFWTDGSSVLDKTGSLMPNGNVSLIGDPLLGKEDLTSSTTQGAVIVPVIDTPGKYYIFSLTEWESYVVNGGVGSYGYAGELFYSVVDMGLNNGLGDVDVLKKGILLDSNVSEEMVAVAGTHCDVWLLVHAYDSAAIEAYNINSNGINPTPVISYCGNFSGLFSYDVSSMKVSPDRRKLCTSSLLYGAELYDFDPATGIVSNAKPISIFDSAIYNSVPFVYESCFSPDNSKLYLMYGYAGELYQCDLTDTTLQSNTLVSNLGGTYIYDIQLGPDGKIYYPNADNTAINCIATPNLAGTACNIIQNAVSLPPGISYTSVGLHNLYVQPLPPDTLYFNNPDSILCDPPFNSLSLHAPSGYSHYLWSTNSTDSVITVNTATMYVSQSVTNNYCQTRYDTFSVKKVNASFTLGTDSIYCSLNPVTLSIPIANANYLWQDNSTDSTYTVTKSGIYSAQVNELGCVYADTIHIRFLNAQQDLGNDTSVCNDDASKITLTANVPAGASALWSTGSIDTGIQVGAGTYWVSVTDLGCQWSDTINIYAQLCSCRVSFPNTFTPNGDGKNDLFHPVFLQGCAVSNYSLVIYNRWGQIVFSSNDPGKGWDGTFNGTAVNIGTYMYTVTYSAGTESEPIRHQKGDITLVR